MSSSISSSHVCLETKIINGFLIAGGLMISVIASW